MFKKPGMSRTINAGNPSLGSSQRDFNPLSISNIVAWFQQGKGVTLNGQNVSQWTDQSGNLRHLSQSTGANQPVYLAFDGTNSYAWSAGVTGNYYSTPDSSASSITGDIDIVADIAADDWTPGTAGTLVTKLLNSGQYSYDFFIQTTGALVFRFTSDGSTIQTATSSVANGITDGSRSWVRATRASATGTVTFYTSTDGSSWTQLGTTISTTAGSIFDGTDQVQIGSNAASPFLGKIYSLTIRSGIGGAGSVKFEPSRWKSGTTWTASTGETWAINSTGAKKSQIVSLQTGSSIVFDGVNDFLKCSAFTLNQPFTVYLLFAQRTWVTGNAVFDGNTSTVTLITQFPTSAPNIDIYAGSHVAGNGNLPVDTFGAVCAIINGSSSSLSVNRTTATTGNPGTNNAAGFTVGATGGGAFPTGIQVKEIAIFSTAHDSYQKSKMISYLSRTGGLGL